MDRHSILVVEDNDRLRRFIISNLTKAGYTVFEAESGKAAYTVLKEQYLDLILLDLRLGDLDGIEILKTIRRQDEDLPVIIVSSIVDQGVKLDGFEIGCDDYITKPFYIEELLGRVRRLLKRTRSHSGSNAGITERILSGPFNLDVKTLGVTKDGSPISMRRKLFDLFLFFVRHPDTILSNEALFDRAWDSREGMNENSLYVHIRQLRTLIEEDPSEPRFIKTVRNAGYIYSPGA